MLNKTNYKQIVISELPYNTCVFHIEESKFRAEAKYIMGIAQFVEYAEYVHPEYVIVDKTLQPIRLSLTMADYIKRYGLDNLRRIGVKRVFGVMDPDQMTNSTTIKLLYEIQYLESIEQCLNQVKQCVVI